MYCIVIIYVQLRAASPGAAPGSAISGPGQLQQPDAGRAFFLGAALKGDIAPYTGTATIGLYIDRRIGSHVGRYIYIYIHIYICIHICGPSRGI